MTFQARVIDAVNDSRNRQDYSVRNLRKQLGGRIMSYFRADNHTAELSGHDFLVVQGMIVDLWASDYYDSPVVVHLKHEATVRRLYGDTRKWKVVTA